MAGTDNKLSDNTIMAHVSGVLIFPGSDRNLASGNIMDAESIGISIGGGSNNEISGNNIRRSSIGIFISTGSTGNKIFKNNLVDNKVQAKDDGLDNVRFKDGHGNYWNDWTSPDADRNGIVDKPYAIAGTSKNVDKYPLAFPYQP